MKTFVTYSQWTKAQELYPENFIIKFHKFLNMENKGVLFFFLIILFLTGFALTAFDVFPSVNALTNKVLFCVGGLIAIVKIPGSIMEQKRVKKIVNYLQINTYTYFTTLKLYKK